MQHESTQTSLNMLSMCVIWNPSKQTKKGPIRESVRENGEFSELGAFLSRKMRILKEEGRGTRCGYEASRGSKGISGFQSRL